MNSSNNKDVTSGIASIIAIVLFVVGVAFNQLPIEITRPKGAEMKSLEAKSLQNVDARLWQDPFSAVKNQIESKSKDNILIQSGKIEVSAAKNHIESESIGILMQSEKIEKQHEIETLRNSINDYLIDGKTITVLGVMVNGGPYAEYAEQRRRMRYAVLAGLANQHYAPEDGEHIGYILTQKSNNDSLKLPEIIPFEWLNFTGRDEQKRKHQVLILWIAEEYFLDKPYIKLLSLFNSFNYESCNINNFKVKVIGPSNSIVLSEITKEKFKMENLDKIKSSSKYQEGVDWNYYHDDYFNIEFYSATTTVSAKFILSKIDGLEKYENEEEAKKKIKEAHIGF